MLVNENKVVPTVEVIKKIWTFDVQGCSSYVRMSASVNNTQAPFGWLAGTTTDAVLVLKLVVSISNIFCSMAN